jgi:hypothetical protein
MHRHMIGLKKSTIVNKAIKCLKYSTLEYIKTYQNVHPNWICNTIYIYLNFQLKSGWKHGKRSQRHQGKSFFPKTTCDMCHFCVGL